MNEKSQKMKLGRGLRLMAKSSMIVFVGLILSKVLTYLYRIIIARYFGPEVYGLFSLALMIIGWFIAFSAFGLAEGILRYIPFYRGKGEYNKIRYVLKSSLIILSFSSITSAIILFFLSGFISINLFHNSDLIIFLKIFSILIPLSILSSVFLAVMRAFEKISWYSFFVNILQNAARVVFLVLLIFVGLKSNAVSFSYFLGALVILVCSYFFCKYKLSGVFGKSSLKDNVKKEIFNELVSYSWPIMFSGVVSSIFYWIDSFTIGLFKTPLEVGFYNVAVPIGGGLLAIVPELFMQLFFPLITYEFSRKNHKLIKELSQQVGKWIFILNLPVFLILFLFPGTIINVLFGPKYLVAQEALRILAIGSLFSSWVVLSQNIISMVGRSKLILTNLLGASLINLILDFLLIQKYGINGVAFATTLVGIGLSLVLFLQVKSLTSIIPLRRRIFRIFIVSLIPTVLLFIIKQYITINLINLILLGFLFFLSYILLIFITGCFDRNDLMILMAIRRKFFQMKWDNEKK